MQLLTAFFMLFGVAYCKRNCKIHVGPCRCKKFKKVVE